MRPTSVVDSISICHWDGHGYKEIIVSTIGDWEGHYQHWQAGIDIYPIPEGGCPVTPPVGVPVLDGLGVGLMIAILTVWGIKRLRGSIS